MARTLYLIDAMALAYRSHFIFISRPLINSKGQNTSAAYGFTNALLKLLDDHAMDHVVVVFDAIGPGGTFRDEIYSEYKANREKMPDDLMANLPRIKEIVRAMDIPVVEAPDVEADDVIGTLAQKAEADGADVVIVSPDKDFQQLLSPGISIFRPAHRGTEFDIKTDETFRDEFGLEPRQFIDVLALMGDSSDNVPGVPGIGEKTAVKLLKEYGSVEDLLDHADDVKGKRAREGLQQHADDARMSKQLVTIHTDCDVALDWTSFERKGPDHEALAEIFRDLEFSSLLRRFEGEGQAKSLRQAVSEGQTDLFSDDPSMAFDFGPYEEVTALDEAEVDYGAVLNRQQLDALVEMLAEQPALSVDTETTSTDAMMASLVGVSFAWKEGIARYVPTPLPDGTSTDAVLDVLQPLLEGDVPKVGQNLKYDYIVLRRHGVQLGGPFFDTMVAHYLIAPEEQHGLDSIARKYLSYRMVPIEQLIGKGKEQRSMRDVPVQEVAPYACEDADIALRLRGSLAEELDSIDLRRIADEMEFPLIRVLAEMELVGIRVDTRILDEISAQLGGELDRIEAEIYQSAGRTFNIGSTVQLGEVLFNPPPTDEERVAAEQWAKDVEDPKAAGKTKKQLKEEAPTFGIGLDSIAKTATGRPKTDENVLEALATEHPLPGLVLDWRKLSKLKSTYVDSLGDLIHPETGRVHTDFNQAVTATGRLSSSNPNLQNIPVRTEQGREIRRAFVPRDGWTLLAADYVQIELRILAALSGDEGLQEAFREGKDIHTDAAMRLYGLDDPEAVTRDMRRKAKNINYGIPYGVSAWGLAQRIRTAPSEAQELIDQYTQAYPRVMGFLAEQVELAREQGYVETKLGRRRYIPGIHARNRTERQFAERVATNMPIQGTQADMIKLAMVRLDRRLADEGFEGRMLLQVHDELVFEAPPDEIDHLRAVIVEEMTAALPLGEVPIEVDVDTGQNWLDAH